MTVTIDSTDKRSVRALAVFATADRWVKGHRKSDNRPFFAIPGSAGRIYYADTRDCTCPDCQQRRVEACKHVLAVRLWKLKHDVAQKAAGSQPAAPADDLGLCTDAELDATMLTIKAEHLVRDADRAERAAYKARLRRELGMTDEVAA